MAGGDPEAEGGAGSAALLAQGEFLNYDVVLGVAHGAGLRLADALLGGPAPDPGPTPDPADHAPDADHAPYHAHHTEEGVADADDAEDWAGPATPCGRR